MGINFWVQFVIQIIILISALIYVFKLEKQRPTKEINPETVDELTEL